jgi:threonyl-tRNA synthetase
VGKKIRDAELAKLPYMLVIGDRELEGGTASVRHHDRGDLGPIPSASLAELIAGE